MASMGTNPAGSAVFLRNQISVSSAIFRNEHDANYFGTTRSSDNMDFSISNTGAVFVFNRNTDQKIRKFSFGISYNQTGSYENELIVSGTTPNSIGGYFQSRAQGLPLNLLQTQSGESISNLYAYLGETEGTRGQDAFLGYQGYIIDPVTDDPNNTSYVTNVGAGPYQQDFYTYSDGFMGKYTLNAAIQMGDNIYLGMNINTHSIDYQEATLLIEKHSNNEGINRIEYENYLDVVGDGFSFQLGGIAKISSNLRLSLSFDSPTWLTISEETSQYLETVTVEDGVDFTTIVDPRIINVFEDYNLRTPYKLSSGVAYVFGNSGLISFEYNYKDYASSKLSPSDNSYFTTLNNSISDNLQGSSTFRFGGEYRWKAFSFRGGYFHEGSPYENDTVLSERQAFSFGIGFNNANYSFDVAFNHAQQDAQQSIFMTSNRYNQSSIQNNFLLSFNMNL